MSVSIRVVLTGFVLCVLLGCRGNSEDLQWGMDVSINTADLSDDFFDDPYFPHADGWASASTHGLRATKNELSLHDCLVCHDRDSTDPGSSGSSDTGSPAGCKSCHANYPHDDNWRDKTNHGQHVIEKGKSGCTSECHGTDLGGGLSGVTCTSCHAQYPHPENWKNADQHGVTAMGNGDTLCVGCHGADLKGADTGVGCYSECHAIYPHDGGTAAAYSTKNWGDVEAHGQYVRENGDSSCSGECHGSDFSGGLSGISCLTGCHSAAYPHPATWNNGTYQGTDDFHGNVASGTSQTLCMPCHGTDLKGGTSGSSCYSCHENYPHTDDNWLGEGMATGHALTFIDLVKNNQTEKCTVCHGSNYDRLVGGVKCTNCHTRGMTHTSGWSASSGHGSFYAAHFTSDDTDPFCQDCHGTLVAFTDDDTLGSTQNECGNCHWLTERTSTQTKEVLASASACYSCHPTYPHKGYQVANDAGEIIIDASWAPSDADSGSHEDDFYYGHVFYLMRNPNFTDESGNLLIDYSPFVSIGYEYEMVAHTCGGTSGSCHFDGNRSTGNVLAESDLCSLYCHRE